MLSVSFLIENAAWKTLVTKERTLFRKALKAAFAHFDQPKKKFNVSILFADDAAVQKLNKEYRSKDKPTNVLSFPQHDDIHDIWAANDNDLELGDIVLAFQTIKTEAKEQNKTLRDHTTHLLVHGLLHLCGYDHTTDEDAEKMEAAEIEILSSLKIKNPYK